MLGGTFFIIFAIWWGFALAVKYFHLRHPAKKPSKYHSSTTFSCFCCPTAYLQRIPLESYLKLLCVSIGILGEAVTGLKHPYDEVLQKYRWSFIEVNAQHITMFFSFGFASFFEILVHSKQYDLPAGIEYVTNILAYAIEGFLFKFHLHGRDEIDIHVHTLLVYSISMCVLASIWEYCRPNQILATYTRIAATFLQGTWFYEAGFILYPPTDSPSWKWTATHGQILIITVTFVWQFLLILVFLLLQTTIVWCVLKRRYKNSLNYNYQHLNNEDEVNMNSNNNNHVLKSLMSVNNNGKTVVDIGSIVQESGDDNESQLEFEQYRTVPQS
ncbi:unnamed protein product [Didymodactylos carnosus]|uniref:Transmembrane protein 45B n=1 Tax=Didymodactylos carnosus TaxID=1234261 RepID=A0A814HZ12_9BILA|nr:unnamed protein product [Didymodactylos carnosus]CAF1017381.1 unnamed protein product [Didymodactylos carnosus]CAF3557014.1 unnamed protein product [Didymodactylos carnosus]CAF3788847.1 unnamed protein product [Didymodactylos carnosus]